MVINRNGYLGVHARSAATFDLEARLPGQVFKRGAEGSLFCEFDAVLTPDFWPALSTMARWHGDSHVEMLVLEPDRDTFYGREYGVFPAFSLPVEAGEQSYWAEIGYEPDGDVMGSIAISANVIAVSGASGKWGCWGERDPEVAVFHGFPSMASKNEWREQFGPFLAVADALDSYLAVTFAGQVVPETYAATLTANYGSRE